MLNGWLIKRFGVIKHCLVINRFCGKIAIVLLNQYNSFSLQKRKGKAIFGAHLATLSVLGELPPSTRYLWMLPGGVCCHGKIPYNYHALSLLVVCCKTLHHTTKDWFGTYIIGLIITFFDHSDHLIDPPMPATVSTHRGVNRLQALKQKNEITRKKAWIKKNVRRLSFNLLLNYSFNLFCYCATTIPHIIHQSLSPRNCTESV